MENFVVSARKYRPQDFKTVVGQSGITNTLRNAIDNNHLAQAFLFCGPRGVGKTSCARILAREINKHAAQEKGEDPNADFSLNIFELDAASNNSVDDIRQLTDQVRFAPQVGTYKVYIIDEVHMLSAQAFNAFLKTLEEPPAHAIFILATTEKHKILPTILSRCQIFDFQRITVRDIAEHLAYIAEKEGVKADPEGLNIIAEKADGAMRDALSMFDQLVSFSGNELTYESVLENLNVLDYDYYFRMVDHVVAHQIPDSLMVYNEILNRGFDGHNFLIGLSQHLRNLMVCKNPQTIELIETSDNIRQRYQTQSEKCSVRFIFKALEVLNDADVQYKGSKNQRLLVELALIRLCAIPGEKKNNSSQPVENKSTPSAAEQTSKPTPVAYSQPAPAPEAKPEKQAPPEYPSAETPAPAEEPAEKPVKEKAEVAVKEVPVSKVEVPQPTAPERAPAKPEPESTSAPISAQRKKVLKKFQSASVSITAGLQSASHNQVEDVSEEHEEYTPETERHREPFSKEEMLEEWKALIQYFRDQRRESMAATLAAHSPKLSDKEHITFPISNAAQEVEINRDKGEILDFLRDKLKNYFLEIDFLLEKSNQPTGLYTNSQKFEAMVKKNPNLGKLSKNLNLDIY